MNYRTVKSSKKWTQKWSEIDSWSSTRNVSKEDSSSSIHFCAEFKNEKKKMTKHSSLNPYKKFILRTFFAFIFGLNYLVLFCRLYVRPQWTEPSLVNLQLHVLLWWLCWTVKSLLPWNQSVPRLWFCPW